MVYDGVGADTFESSLASLRLLGTLVTFGNASGKVRQSNAGARPWQILYINASQTFMAVR